VSLEFEGSFSGYLESHGSQRQVT